MLTLKREIGKNNVLWPMLTLYCVKLATGGARDMRPMLTLEREIGNAHKTRERINLSGDWFWAKMACGICSQDILQEMAGWPAADIGTYSLCDLFDYKLRYIRSRSVAIEKIIILAWFQIPYILI